MTSTTLPAWVSSFFDQSYVQYNLDWPTQKRQHVAQHLVRLLKLQPNDWVFDQCCGTGDLSWGLAELGLSCVGVDQSAQYIQMAQEKTQSFSNMLFVAGDAGVYTPPHLVDGAVNWHTSLGYGGEEGAQHILQQLRRCVKPGKYYLIDCRNLTHYQQQPTDHEEQINTSEGVKTLKRTGVWNGHVLTQQWKAYHNNELIWQQDDASCFHPSEEELTQWIEQMGDVVVGVQGGLDTDVLTENDPRMIVVAQRN